MFFSLHYMKNGFQTFKKVDSTGELEIGVMPKKNCIGAEARDYNV